MNALIICSVHALCDMSDLEREACNQACAQHGIPAILTARDHARILETTTMLDLLGHLPGTKQQREDLIATYLDILNEKICNVPLPVRQRVGAAVLQAKTNARPIGFASDYPLLTTNLVRAAALLTHASKLGHLTALTDPSNVPPIAIGLETTANALGVAHKNIDVLVAHRRDFAAAQALGMRPRFVAEPLPKRNARKPIRWSKDKGRAFGAMSIPEDVAVPA